MATQGMREFHPVLRIMTARAMFTRERFTVITSSIRRVIGSGVKKPGKKDLAAEAFHLRSEKLNIIQMGSNYHIEAKRIQTIDAGHQEEWTIELYTAASNDPPLTADFIKQTHSQLPASNVQILRNCKGRFSGPH